MRPSVGRIVHFTPASGGRAVAAIVTRVDEQLALPTHPHLADDEASFQVWLVVFNHTSTIQDVMFSDGPVSWAPEPKPGCWSWPPRV